MTAIRTFATLTFALGLVACGTVEPPSRGAMDRDMMTLATRGEAPTRDPQAVGLVLASQYDVEDIRIAVPRSLRVSEANTFYPIADIVWRGEGIGDRHAQVAAIFSEAMQTATAPMQSGRKVVVEVTVVRFHCLTEKTRYTVGGTHSLKFDLTVRDAETGVVLDGPREIVADIKAAGGAAALAEDQAGRTQRVVVVERLGEVLRRELSARVAPQLLSQVVR